MITLLFLLGLSASVGSSVQDEIFDKLIDCIHDGDILSDFVHDPEFILYTKARISENPNDFIDFLPDEDVGENKFQIKKKFWKKLAGVVIDFVVWKYGGKNGVTSGDVSGLGAIIEYIDTADENFAIPAWVVAAVKFLIQEVIHEIASKYEITVNWEPTYLGKYQAFLSYVRTVVSRRIKNFPVKVALDTYKGSPSVVIYWSGKASK